MSKPMISVIMPVYNAEKYLDASINSILSQSYQNFEFLIFNDGSTDNSLAILSRYASVDKRIRVFNHTQNVGYLVHLNNGLKMANGEIIARMDADDICHIERFSKQVEILLAGNADIIASNVIFFKNSINNRLGRSKNPISTQEILYSSLFKTPVFHPTVMFKKDIFLSGDYYYDAEYYPAEDYELWSRLLLKYKFYNIQEPLLFYRKSEGQISVKNNKIQIQHAFKAKCRFVQTFFGIMLSDSEKEVLFKFLYYPLKRFEESELKMLLYLFKQMIGQIKKPEERKTFCRQFIIQLAYYSSKKNKFFSAYYKNGLSKYYRGNLQSLVQGMLREWFK